MQFNQFVGNLAKAIMGGSAIRHAQCVALAMLAFDVQALSPGQVFEKVKDSVVVVNTLDANGKTIGQGSGVVLPTGKIGTNCHVVKDGASFQVGGGNQFVPATLWGSDDDKDICLLEASGLAGEPARLGRASALKVGEPVYAVGAPRGLELSLSDGIVSQLRGGPPPLIQTTTAISPGSSGGGLFDAEGSLVGFTTLYIEGGQSLNFAMPVEWVEEIKPGRKVARGRSETDWRKRASALQFALNWAGMRDWCQEWTKAQPGNSDAWYFLGQSYFSLELHTEAAEAFRQAVRVNPENRNAWFSLGQEYRHLKRHAKAVEAYRQVLRIIGDGPGGSGVWYEIGLSYDELKRYDEAIEAYRRAQRIAGSGWSGPWLALGTVYDELKRYDEAIEAYRQGLRISPEFPGLWLLLGLAYEHSGNHTAALETVSQLRRIDPAEADKLSDMIAPPAPKSNKAAGWVDVGSTDAGTLYANPTTIRKAGSRVKMWDMTDYKTVQGDEGERYLSSKSQYEYDCKEERKRMLAFSSFSENMGGGKAVHSAPDPAKWNPVVPDSVGEVLWKFACKKR